MRKILALTACLLSTLSAEFVIEEEDAAYNDVVRRTREIIQPIHMQAQDKKARISALANIEVEPLKCKREALNDEMQTLHRQQDSIREQNAIAKRSLKEEQDFRLKSMIAPMEAELAARRTPILGDVAKLTEERNSIESEHSRLKADPKWGRWVEGIDSLDAGLKMGFKDEAIKKLYASVDGDLPAQIAAARSAIEGEFHARLLGENARHRSETQTVKSILEELSVAKDLLCKEIRVLENQEALEIRKAMPVVAVLIQGIEDQLVNELISGVIP